MWIETFIQQPTPQEQTTANKKASYFLWWFTLVMLIILWINFIPKQNAEAQELYDMKVKLEAMSWQIADLWKQYRDKETQCWNDLLDIHNQAEELRTKYDELFQQATERMGLKLSR